MSVILLILIPGAVLTAIGCFDADIPAVAVAVGWFVWTVSLLSSNWGL